MLDAAAIRLASPELPWAPIDGVSRRVESDVSRSSSEFDEAFDEIASNSLPTADKISKVAVAFCLIDLPANDWCC